MQIVGKKNILINNLSTKSLLVEGVCGDMNNSAQVGHAVINSFWRCRDVWPQSRR